MSHWQTARSSCSSSRCRCRLLYLLYIISQHLTFSLATTTPNITPTSSTSSPGGSNGGSSGLSWTIIGIIIAFACIAGLVVVGFIIWCIVRCVKRSSGNNPRPVPAPSPAYPSQDFEMPYRPPQSAYPSTPSTPAQFHSTTQSLSDGRPIHAPVPYQPPVNPNLYGYSGSQPSQSVFHSPAISPSIPETAFPAGLAPMDNIPSQHIRLTSPHLTASPISFRNQYRPQHP